jgi:hypothetical protein
MNLVNDAGTFFLNEKGKRVSLTSQELELFRQMTPLGRKVTLRKRASDRILANPEDEEARLMFELSQLPAREWSFLIPDKTPVPLASIA